MKKWLIQIIKHALREYENTSHNEVFAIRDPVEADCRYNRNCAVWHNRNSGEAFELKYSWKKIENIYDHKRDEVHHGTSNTLFGCCAKREAKDE